jgi:acyl carrier protein
VSDLRQRVVEIFADVFQMEVDPGVADLEADQIEGWDSVNKLRLVMELEQAFDVQLADEDVVDLHSLQGAIALLTRRKV